jgi:hypothetical protein
MQLHDAGEKLFGGFEENFLQEVCVEEAGEAVAIISAYSPQVIVTAGTDKEGN